MNCAVPKRQNNEEVKIAINQRKVYPPVDSYSYNRTCGYSKVERGQMCILTHIWIKEEI